MTDQGPGGADATPAWEEVVERLERWQRFGGVWRVASATAGSVTLSLCRCDGGEEVERLTSTDPEALTWLAGRTQSEQGGGIR